MFSYGSLKVLSNSPIDLLQLGHMSEIPINLARFTSCPQCLQSMFAPVLMTLLICS